MIKIEDILNERKRALMKCDTLSINYDGSKNVQDALLNAIDIIKDKANTRYVEVSSRDSDDTGDELYMIICSIDGLAKSGVEQRFKICRDMDYDILRCEAYVNYGVFGERLDTPSADDRLLDSLTASDIYSHMYIFHDNLNQIEDFSILGIYILYKYEKTEYVNGNARSTIKTNTLAKCVIGNDAVERELANGSTLYNELVREFKQNKIYRGKANWDAERSMITYRGEET